MKKELLNGNVSELVPVLDSVGINFPVYEVGTRKEEAFDLDTSIQQLIEEQEFSENTRPAPAPGGEIGTINYF